MNQTSQTLAEFCSNRDLLIIDFEATCWGPQDHKPNAPPGCRYPNEIIEFGAVLFSSRVRRIEDEFQAFVRPTIHPVLTRFCTELTTIRQRDVDRAERFPVVLEQFKEHFGLARGSTDPNFASWGAYDRGQLMDDCRKHTLEYPFDEANHLNLKFLAADVLGLPRTKRGTAKVFAHLGLEFQGTQHRAIDDARNYTFLVQYLLETFGGRPLESDLLT